MHNFYSGKTYEDARSLNQQLSFEYFQKEMSARSLESGTMQMRSLHMLGEDGLFTNLALLLSDQCEHTMKVAIFQGIDKTVFRDRKEFTGSLFKQLEDVYQFIDLNNRTKAIFSGLNRVDKRDYPEDAIREALLNSITHRDYSFSGSTLINLYDDRIEFVSLGGLVPGLSMEAIFMGVSQSRNPHLAGILYRMRLIESYGTGIRKILRLYHDEMSKPKFETAEGAFRVTLFNRNATYSPETQPAAQNEKDIIFEYALEQGGITRKEAEELIGAGPTKAFRLLKELCSEGKMYTEGNGKKSKYIPN